MPCLTTDSIYCIGHCHIIVFNVGPYGLPETPDWEHVRKYSCAVLLCPAICSLLSCPGSSSSSQNASAITWGPCGAGAGWWMQLKCRAELQSTSYLALGGGDIASLLQLWPFHQPHPPRSNFSPRNSCSYGWGDIDDAVLIIPNVLNRKRLHLNRSPRLWILIRYFAKNYPKSGRLGSQHWLSTMCCILSLLH